MKNIKKSRIYFSLFIGMLFWGNVSAQNPVQYKVTENSYEKVTISFSASKLNHEEIKTDKGIFTRISMDGCHKSADIGKPELPVLVKMLEIPICEDIQITVSPKNITFYDIAEMGITYPVYPAQPSYSKSHEGPVTLIKDESTYSEDVFYGLEEIATIEKTGIMRSVNMATLYISPVFYNPVAQKILVMDEIDIEITYKNADIEATEKMKKLHGNDLFSGLESHLINPVHPQSKDVISSAPIKYLIVSHSQFQAQLQSFVEWKKRKGFIVVEAYTNQANVGTTTTSIKNYIKSHYTNATATDPAPTYVLFVGDVAQLPSFSGTTDTHPTDLYYCDWTNDNLPDCYYGRFSAETVAQLIPQIEKTLIYEQYTMRDPSYLDEAVLVAGADSYWSPTHANGQINYIDQLYVNTAYGYSTVYKYLHPASSYASTIRNNIGKGVGLANYTAHCLADGWADPGFEVSHVPAMGNSEKYGLMIGNCCLSNKFDESVCFGEALLRATDKGAIGYIGGSNNTYWDEDIYWAVGVRSNINANMTYNAGNLGAYDRLFHTHNEPYSSWFTSNGAIITGGNLSVQASTSSRKKYYWEIYHLMGDPSVMTWLTQAGVMPLTVSNTLVSGTTSLEVQTAPHAYIALTQNLNLLASAFADESGTATLTFSAITSGSYELAVSAQNYQTLFTPVTVINPTGAYVVANTPVLLDPNGNNNNLPEPGENVQWDVTFDNLGVANASNVYAKLTTNSPYVTITQDSVFIGNIGTGASTLQNAAFKAELGNCFADRTIAGFTLSVHDGININTIHFNVTLNAPDLALTKTSFTETSGNHNGNIDPGEEFSLSITFTNNGHADADGLTSELVSLYTKAVVNHSPQNVGSIPSGGEAVSIFSISIDPIVPTGTIIPFYHTLYNHEECEIPDTLYVMVGTALEDFETGSFTKFDWQNGTYPWVIVSAGIFEGSFSAKSAAIGNNQESTLEITLDVLADDSISYYRSVSSENNYDIFSFYIDNTSQEQLSGNRSWGRACFPVTAGRHTFKFEYKKDLNTSSGADCAWIDFITLPVSLQTGMMAGDNTKVSENKPLVFSVYPNPANDQITIQSTEGILRQVEIFDITGKTVQLLPDIHDTQTVLSISNLSNGLYFIRIVNEDRQTGIQKFIKKQ